jgi:hypothetical protein
MVAPMLSADLARALDATLLAADCGITPDEWQAEVLRMQPRRTLLLCSRQSGKSTVSALLALHVALYSSPALVLLISPSLRQSSELFRTVMEFHSRLAGVAKLDMESVLKCTFANGSRIVSLPGSERTTRGFAKPSLVVVDEAARCDDTLMAAVRPMLATSYQGGKLLMLSTPAGKRGFFHQAWTEGGSIWHRVEVPASMCPRITPEFLAEEMAQLGAQRFSEEYGLQFLDPTESVFPTFIIDAAFTPEVLPLWA